VGGFSQSQQVGLNAQHLLKSEYIKIHRNKNKNLQAIPTRSLYQASIVFSITVELCVAMGSLVHFFSERWNSMTVLLGKTFEHDLKMESCSAGHTHQHYG